MKKHITVFIIILSNAHFIFSQAINSQNLIAKNQLNNNPIILEVGLQIIPFQYASYFHNCLGLNTSFFCIVNGNTIERKIIAFGLQQEYCKVALPAIQSNQNQTNCDSNMRGAYSILPSLHWEGKNPKRTRIRSLQCSYGATYIFKPSATYFIAGSKDYCFENVTTKPWATCFKTELSKGFQLATNKFLKIYMGFYVYGFNATSQLLLFENNSLSSTTWAEKQVQQGSVFYGLKIQF